MWIWLRCTAKWRSCALSRHAGLCIRIARQLNSALGRKGRVLADRYHSVALDSSKRLRAALCYVINNERRHCYQHGGWEKSPRYIDPCSSGRYFHGWRDVRVHPSSGLDPPVASPEGYALRAGWRRHGLIGLQEIPARAASDRALRRRARGAPDRPPTNTRRMLCRDSDPIAVHAAAAGSGARSPRHAARSCSLANVRREATHVPGPSTPRLRGPREDAAPSGLSGPLSLAALWPVDYHGRVMERRVSASLVAVILFATAGVPRALAYACSLRGGRTSSRCCCEGRARSSRGKALPHDQRVEARGCCKLTTATLQLPPAAHDRDKDIASGETLVAPLVQPASHLPVVCVRLQPAARGDPPPPAVPLYIWRCSYLL